MDDPVEKEEIRSVSAKVLAFGMTAVTVLVVLICGCLLVGLYSMSSRYVDQMTISQEKQETISVLQRALDRAEGKLAVYEEFITDRRQTIVNKMIITYLRKEKIKSTDASLKDFEQWIGIGGR